MFEFIKPPSSHFRAAARWRVAGILSALLLVVGSACTNVSEGQFAGDCSDGADNDTDGLFDCADPGCVGSVDCLDAGVDAGTEDGAAGCSCNVSPACDPEAGRPCACDPDCAPGCACDVSTSCDPGCACDVADCMGACACDTDFSCTPGCACDPECPSCTCDTTGSCDAGCACDTDCDPSACTPVGELGCRDGDACCDIGGVTSVCFNDECRAGPGAACDSSELFPCAPNFYCSPSMGRCLGCSGDGDTVDECEACCAAGAALSCVTFTDDRKECEAL